RLAARLATFWDDAGYVSEGRTWLQEALAAGRHCEPALRARAGVSAGWLTLLQGDHAAAQASLEEAIPILREVGNEPELGWALATLAQVRSQQRDYGYERSLLEERLALERASTDPGRLPDALCSLAYVIALQGDYRAGRALCDEALAMV